MVIMIKTVSCGFVLDSKLGTLALLPTGRKPGSGKYDIAKGQVEKRETPLACAVRELNEESGIELTPEQIAKAVDMGRFKYRPNKDLHLFYLYLDDEDLVDNFQFKCASTFETHEGNELPEMCDGKWTTDTSYYFESLQPIVELVLKKNRKGKH